MTIEAMTFQTKRWSPQKILNLAAGAWMITAFLGMILFALYILSFYGGSAIDGNLQLWNEVSIKGYLKGDFWGNAFFASHIAMAFIVSLGGIIQLIPNIRRRAIQIHKWNGRLYLITAMIAATGGLYLVWVRESTLNLWGSICISLNAVLIIVFGSIAWVYARNQRVRLHRIWALRTFMMASGVWFFRIGMMAWIILNQGPVGITDNLDGPFDRVWSLVHFILPLVLLEGYMYVHSSTNRSLQQMGAVMLFIITVITAIGIFGAASLMWYPRIN